MSFDRVEEASSREPDLRSENYIARSHNLADEDPISSDDNEINSMVIRRGRIRPRVNSPYPVSIYSNPTLMDTRIDYGEIVTSSDPQGGGNVVSRMNLREFRLNPETARETSGEWLNDFVVNSPGTELPLRAVKTHTSYFHIRDCPCYYLGFDLPRHEETGEPYRGPIVLRIIGKTRYVPRGDERIRPDFHDILPMYSGIVCRCAQSLPPLELHTTRRRGVRGLRMLRILLVLEIINPAAFRAIEQDFYSINVSVSEYFRQQSDYASMISSPDNFGGYDVLARTVRYPIEGIFQINMVIPNSIRQLSAEEEQENRERQRKARSHRRRMRIEELSILEARLAARIANTDREEQLIEQVRQAAIQEFRQMGLEMSEEDMLESLDRNMLFYFEIRTLTVSEAARQVAERIAQEARQAILERRNIEVEQRNEAYRRNIEIREREREREMAESQAIREELIRRLNTHP